MNRLRKNLVLAALFCSMTAPGLTQTPRSFAYILQAENLKPSRPEIVSCLAACGRDWIVLDASYNSESRWTPAEIQTIRAGQPGRKVLAYLSIGEAEDYRPYWKKEWGGHNQNRGLQPGAPAFLCTENPDWPGNYRVRYWQKEWQALILSALAEIVGQGFDGVYMDLVDAFEFFEYDQALKEWRDEKINPETGQSYRADMKRWVGEIALTSRRDHPGFLVIPQNGSQLLADPKYAELVDGIGIEDLFTVGNKSKSKADTAYVVGFLQNLLDRKKPVLTIEYGSQPEAQELSVRGAGQHGYTLLITDRQLRTLGKTPPPNRAGENSIQPK